MNKKSVKSFSTVSAKKPNGDFQDDYLSASVSSVDFPKSNYTYQQRTLIKHQDHAIKENHLQLFNFSELKSEVH